MYFVGNKGEYMGKIIAIVNQKGGVAKTTTTYNLGACLAQMGKKVLLVDLDQQGNLTYCMGHDVPDEVEHTIAHMMLASIAEQDYDKEEFVTHNVFTVMNEKKTYNLDALCCNVMMSTVEINLVNTMSREQVLKYVLEEFKDEYDYILLDCGPSLGMITINALVASDSVLIPLQAEKFAALGLEELVKNILRVKRRLNPNLDIEGILFTSVPEKHKESIQTISEVKEKFGTAIPIYDFVIPRLTEVTKAIRKQVPMICFSDNRKGKSVVADLYEKLAEEVIG